MAGAVRLAGYFLRNALAAFDALPEKAMFVQAGKILEMIRKKRLHVFDRRTAMRNCRSFKTVAEIQPVLDFLDDYGYIRLEREVALHGYGRPLLPKYTVNPWVLEQACHAVRDPSGEV